MRMPTAEEKNLLAAQYKTIRTLCCLLSPTTTKGSAFQEVLRLIDLHHTTEESHRATAEVATNPQFEQADVNKCRNKWV